MAGVGIIDGAKGIFNPELAGEGTWKIIFQQTKRNKDLKDSINIVVKNCITDVNSVSVANEVSISPNPAHDILRLKTDGSQYRISIINIEGKVIQNSNIQSTNVEMAIENLPNGIYILQIKNENYFKALKFIKE